MAYQRWYPPGGAIGPLTPSKPWDQVRIGGFLLPCHHAVITAGGVELREDKKGGTGQSGASLTYHGMDPQPVTIDVFFSTVEQANNFTGVIALVGPLPGVPPRAFSIEAQALEGSAITAVTVRKVSALLDALPFKRITVTCRHFLPPEKTKNKPVTGSPKASTDNLRSEEAARLQNPPPSARPGYGAPSSG